MYGSGRFGEHLFQGSEQLGLLAVLGGVSTGATLCDVLARPNAIEVRIDEALADLQGRSVATQGDEPTSARHVLAGQPGGNPAYRRYARRFVAVNTCYCHHGGA